MKKVDEDETNNPNNKKSTFDDHFSHNMTILTIGGMIRPSKDATATRRILWTIYNFICMLLSVGFCPMEIMPLLISTSDLSQFVKNMNMAMQHVSASIKLYVWFKKRDRLVEIVEILKEKLATYENYETFRPSEIVGEEMKSKRIIDCVWLYCCCSVATSAVIDSFVMLSTQHEKFDTYSFTEVDGRNETLFEYTQPLAYVSLIPWHHKSSYFLFGCALIYQWYPVFNFAFIIVGFDTMFTTIVDYSSAQLRVLQEAFRTIRPRILHKMGLRNVEVIRDPPEIAKEMNKELNKCIEHLQTILRMIEELEGIFSILTLIQVLISLIMFCTSLYLLSDVPVGSSKFVVEFIYLVAVTWQIYQYCYFGNKVTLMGFDVPFAIYDADWFSADQSFKRKMILTMHRMQKPIHFTIGKFSTLTLSTFVSIARGSYSFFTFLKNKE